MILLHEDDRGFVFSGDDFFSILVSNPRVHTLRGIHYQEKPFSMRKSITLISGKIRLVVVNLEKDTFSIDDYEVGDRIYSINENSAVGYLTLEPNTSLHYGIDSPRYPEFERGIRWNDPFFSIDWGIKNPFMNERDKNWPDFKFFSIDWGIENPFLKLRPDFKSEK